MAVLIGTDTVSSIARHVIMPTIPDQVYGNILMLYRLMRANKRVIGGGTQIEVPQLYADFSTGSAYQGFETMATTPHDTIKNLAFDWKQYYVTWAIDGLTLIKTDSADAIANILTLQAQQAYMRMATILSNGLWGDGVTTGAGVKEIDGLRGAIGNNVVGNANYGTQSRSSNVWHRSYIDAATTTLSFQAMRNMISGTTFGGYHPTILVSGKTVYNLHWGLYTSTAGYGRTVQVQPSGHDEMLAQAGWTNLLFEGIPHAIDDNCPAGNLFALNENVLQWVVSPRGDFYMEDFQKPVNQDAMVAALLWAGNLVSQSSRLHGRMTAIAG
jgi:hypothetical protein